MRSKKAKKLAAIIGFAIVIFIIIINCYKEKSAITIFIIDEELPYYTEIKDNKNEEVSWEKYIQNTEKILYLKLGSEIKFDISNKDIKELIIQDAIVNDDGTMKYQKSANQVLDYELDEDNMYKFYLPANLAVGFDSESIYEEGKCLRGIDISYKYNNRYYHCLFAIKTDLFYN